MLRHFSNQTEMIKTAGTYIELFTNLPIFTGKKITDMKFKKNQIDSSQLNKRFNRPP